MSRSASSIFARNVRAACDHLGVTLAQIAAKLRVTEQAVSKTLARRGATRIAEGAAAQPGRRPTGIGLDQVADICRALRVPPEILTHDGRDWERIHRAFPEHGNLITALKISRKGGTPYRRRK